MARLGIMIEGQEDITWERWRKIVDTAERLGYDSVWRSDHLHSVMGRYERETLALWPSLTAAGIWSERLEFGALVSPLTFRHPVHLAMTAVSLNSLSGGRFWLGVGAGWNESEHQTFGFDLMPVGERMDRFEEGLEVITALWSGEEVTYEGEHFQLENAMLAATPPDGKVPMIIGGSGEKRTLRIVAKYADDWNAQPIGPEAYKHKVEVLEQHCAEVGRDPAEIQRSIMLGHIVGRDHDEVVKRMERYMEITGRYSDVEEGLATLRERGYLVGTPAEVVEQIQLREEQGLERFMLQTLDPDDLDALALIADEVLPRVS